MQLIQCTLDTSHQNSLIGNVTQFDNAVLELQVVTGGKVGDPWESPEFELIAMKRDGNLVREVDQDKFTILSKEDHKVQIELKEQFLTCRGSVKMQLVIKDGGRLSTTLFYLSIGRSLDHEIAESLTDIQVLDDLDQVVESLGALEVTASANESKRQENEKLREVAEVNRQEEFDQSQLQRDTKFNNKMEEFQEQVSGLEGIQGKPGETPQIRVNETHIQLKYPSQQEWTDLVALESLKGPEGPIGPPGIQGKTGEPGKDGANGENGQDGMTPNFTIGTVTTLEPGQEATVTIRGPKENPILDIAIPRGPNGKDGEGGVSATDKVDYMGEQHDTLKETNDANVEYLLREINTAHYEGSNITATDTYQKQVKSAILKGNTLVNLTSLNENYYKHSNITSFEIENNYLKFTTKEVRGVIFDKTPNIKPNTKYFVIVDVKSNPFEFSLDGYDTNSNQPNTTKVLTYNSGEVGIKTCIITTGNSINYNNGIFRIWTPLCSKPEILIIRFMILEYQDGMENWDIPYFEGMQSVKMPVLTTTNKIDGISKGLITMSGRITDVIDNANFTIKTTGSRWTGAVSSRFYTQDMNSEFGTKYVIEFDGKLLKGDLTTSYGIKLEAWSEFIEGYNGKLPTNGKYRAVIKSSTNPANNRSTYFGIYTTDSTSIAKDVEYQIRNLRVYPVNDNDEIYKSNILTVDGEYGSVGDVADTVNLITGEVIQRTELRAYQEGDESNLEVMTDMTNTRYKLAVPLIKTVDLSGQKVYSYDGTTHYSCSAAEGALVPTLSIDVPTNLPALVSRQRTTIESQKEQIITLEQENEQLIAQNEVQDIDISLNQDAINFMLFAPATMLLNDESRNNEGVNAMAAYLANQILKGKLDYALVVGRYGSYKEDIDTILIAEGKQDLIK